MARHNRDAEGSDQRDQDYTISYQPDWLRQVKVTRLLPTGRQSTKTLFTNPEAPQREPGREVRTEIRSEAEGLEFQVAIRDPHRVIKRVIVETGPPDSVAGDMGPDDIHFTIDHRI